MAHSEAKLRKIMGDVFNVDPDSINEESSVDTVAGWDSLNHLSLVLSLEEAFNITFTEEQTVEILNYPLIKAVLKEHGVEIA